MEMEEIIFMSNEAVIALPKNWELVNLNPVCRQFVVDSLYRVRGINDNRLLCN